MRNRIKAAWMVLRGEWTASAPAPPVVFVNHFTHDQTSNPTVFTGGWWMEPRQ